MGIRIEFGRRDLPIGLPTLEQAQAVLVEAQGMATTAAVDAVAEAMPRIDAAISDAAGQAAVAAAEQAAPVAADAVRAQVAGDADRAETAAEALTGVTAQALPDDDGLAQLIAYEVGGATALGQRETGLDFMPSDELVPRIMDKAAALGIGSVPAPAGGWGAEIVDGAVQFTAPAGAGIIDRFRLDGATWRPVARVVELIILYGQSNSGITAMGEPTVWTAPPTPHHALTFDDAQAGRGGVRGLLGLPPIKAPTALVPAVEVFAVQSLGLATAARLAEISDGVPTVSIVRAEARGGQPFIGLAPGEGLWRDSLGVQSQALTNLIASAGTAITLAEAQGYEIDAITITFDHQEADQGDTRAGYLANWLGMKAEAEAALAPLGKPVRWLVTQAAGHRVSGNAWGSRLAICDATLRANGGGNVTMTMPRYWMSLGMTTGATQDPIHHGYDMRVLQGEIIAFAMRELRAGRPWRCAYPASVVQSGTTLTVEFDSILPLVLDAAPAHPVPPNHGFGLDGTAATITAVAQTGPRQIRLTTSAPATAARLRYAFQSAGTPTPNYALGTGSLRETWAEQSRWLRGTVLHRWALGFEWQM